MSEVFERVGGGVCTFLVDGKKCDRRFKVGTFLKKQSHEANHRRGIHHDNEGDDAEDEE